MNRKLHVSDLMTKNLIYGKLDNSLEQLLSFFGLYKIQHLPIATDEGTLLGILSINDVLDYLSKQMTENRTFGFDALNMKFDMSTVMTKDPVALDASDQVDKAFAILGDAPYQALPVINNGKLVGIITNKDLVRYAAKS